MGQKRKHQQGYTQQRDASGKLQWMKDNSASQGGHSADTSVRNDFLAQYFDNQHSVMA